MQKNKFLKLSLLLFSAAFILSFNACQPIIDEPKPEEPSGGQTVVSYSFALDIEKGGKGTGVIDGNSATVNGEYKEKTEVTALAKADAGSIFTGWYDAAQGGKLVSTVNPYSFKLSSNTALFARFEPAFNFSTEVSTAGTGNGTIDRSVTPVDGGYLEGTPLTLKCIVNDDSLFDGWYDAASGGKLVSRQNPFSTTLTKDTVLYAKLSLKLFPDISLEEIVRERIYKMTGRLVAADVANLKDLGRDIFYSPTPAIVDLRGLESCTSIMELDLGGNKIVDITPLSGLKSLTFLNLESNKISQIMALSGLTSLETLNLQENSISDITGLSNMSMLTTLNLGFNQIADLTALSKLKSLQRLTLHNNFNLRDITALEGLSGLTEVNLELTLVQDLTPLVNNVEFATDDTLFLSELFFTYPPEQIAALKAKGVTVTVR